ncbi:lipase family protein (macronuclear) [Tetrahymena thermophila SB210]|uniref:Lipase family protein n=1 Tax=Tetrahymena thermophila (strain SB210) TaxID=312017 RepID=Q22SH0_TETTS|nr:lipase family protein [Tetrahymena thermophila SB210]EAR87802.2 lipase family protein [Tetrahymena thermophila SB210]|eukprot:XP_001008047.2 lipase family protein [Tetrahymena thermophila SB210]
MMKTLILLILVTLSQCIQYNETESIQLAAYSLSSYCKSDNLSPYNCGKICERSGELSDVQFMNDYEQNLFGYIGYQPQKNQILVVFRGSILSDKKNVLIDLDILKINYPFCQNCKVSKGFLGAYQKLKSQANKLIQEYKQRYNDAQIVATGHSLGAALASLFVVDVFETFNYQVDYMFTFGSPRVGNQHFANYFNQIISPDNNFRVFKGKDSIARFPSSTIGYNHFGQGVYYDEQDNYIFCQNEFDANCNQYYFWQLNFADHQKYVKCTFSQFRGDQMCTGSKNENI